MASNTNMLRRVIQSALSMSARNQCFVDTQRSYSLAGLHSACSSSYWQVQEQRQWKCHSIHPWYLTSQQQAHGPTQQRDLIHRHFSSSSEEQEEPQSEDDDKPDHNSLPDLHPTHKHSREHGSLVTRHFDEGTAHRTAVRLHKSSWMQLLPHPVYMYPEQLAARLKVLGNGLLQVFLGARTRAKLADIQESVQEGLERSFDLEVFKQGCREAVTAVLQAYGERDWGALRDMVSEEMQAVMQAQHEEMAEVAKWQVESIGADIKQLEPRAFGFWGPEHIQVFDSRWASPASLQGAATSSFLVVVVYVHALVDTRVQYTSKAGKEHHVSLPLTKSGFWLFARGPVPAEAVDELERPWYVVGTW